MDKTIQVLAVLVCLVVMNICATHAKKQTNPGCKGWSQKGKVQKIGGIKSYISGPADSNISIILASDIFGYEVPHLRMIADKVGGAGFYAVVPDFFNGDPYVSFRPWRPFIKWIVDHPAEKGIEDAKRVIEALKGKGIVKIGGAGFCWGGKVVVDLAAAQSPYVQAAVLLHPTYVSIKDIQRDKVPMSILGGENDTKESPPTRLKQFKSALKAIRPKVDSFLKIYKGAGHGWTTRYNDTDAVAVKAARKAHSDMLHWLQKYLKKRHDKLCFSEQSASRNKGSNIHFQAKL